MSQHTLLVEMDFEKQEDYEKNLLRQGNYEQNLVTKTDLAEFKADFTTYMEARSCRLRYWIKKHFSQVYGKGKASEIKK